ncbi:MAG: GTPase domain-containing protein [Candidatus Heimdallarchaeota archaeon]|nr:GTPase domain-containing protein [Candidatus Heimdallarchaeota archaeon]
MISLNQLVLKKITLLGTTGAGKTTFLESIFGEFQKNDVRRDVRKEFADNYDFTPIKDNSFNESTTTISLNVVNTIMGITRFNSLVLRMYKEKDQISFEDLDIAFQVVFNDPAGQERFDFMQDIAIKGSHLVILMADGTNISSIEKLIYYTQLVKIEENRLKRDIPIIVFINKSDLKTKGVFLGRDIAERALHSTLIDKEIIIYETSNYRTQTYNEPFNIIFNYLNIQDFS